MQIALDPATCDQTWGRGCISWGSAHKCERDERHAGAHRCDCGREGKRAPKKTRKPKPSTLKNRADKLWAAKIKEGGVCQLKGVDGINCGGPRLEAAHIIGRRFHSTRFDLDNGMALCQGHHVFYTHNPEAWFLIVERLQPGKWQELWERAQVPWHKNIEANLKDLTP